MPNPGVPYETLMQKNLLSNVEIDETAVAASVSSCSNISSSLNGNELVESYLKAITLIDLTSLTGDESAADIQNLCHRAENPISKEILQGLHLDANIKCAAVCVYPKFASDCVKILKSLNSSIPVAAVAGGFPLGELPLSEKLSEVDSVVRSGAKEVDVVINKKYVLAGDWKGLYEEVKSMKDKCIDNVHMKVIIKTGELGSLTNVHLASVVSMAAGADFIKTSTGKEAVNATLPVGAVMSRAIKLYNAETGFKVGFKPAGGLKTGRDALQWLKLIKQELGSDWIDPSCFRIGASSLLDNIVQQLSVLVDV